VHWSACRSWFVTQSATVFVCLLLVAGCNTSDHGAPTTLMDGSRALEPPIDLEGVVRRAVLTTVATTRIDEIEAGSAIEACVRRAQGDRLSGPIVVRVGVNAQTVTFRAGSGRGLYGCDNGQGPREAGQQECGVAFGELAEGRLRDPRLNVGGCTTKDGEPLGFAWVEPIRQARYVVVEHDGYAEVYKPAGGLPVRVMTTAVDLDHSSAVFRVSEHAANGAVIRRYELEASVAG
jgi:hypothetical protein